MEREVGQKLALEICFCGRFLLMIGHDAAGIVFFFAEGNGRIIVCVPVADIFSAAAAPVAAAAAAAAAAVPTDVALRSSIDVACPAAPVESTSLLIITLLFGASSFIRATRWLLTEDCKAQRDKRVS